jgi:EAL domain-containing protein (putative c-di-GMP-specific phosphodiesterase class I)
MGELRALGVQVGMDDFGTGYSSLAYLANLPFDFVKIDRSFLARFVEDRRAAALLASVATLCRTLGLAAIAEGVETEQQLHHLRELGIPYVQGFLFGRPVPPAEFGRPVPPAQFGGPVPPAEILHPVPPPELLHPVPSVGFGHPVPAAEFGRPG